MEQKMPCFCHLLVKYSPVTLFSHLPPSQPFYKQIRKARTESSPKKAGYLANWVPCQRRPTVFQIGKDHGVRPQSMLASTGKVLCLLLCSHI